MVEGSKNGFLCVTPDLPPRKTDSRDHRRPKQGESVFALAVLSFVFLLLPTSSLSATIEAGHDLQASLKSAAPGDVVLVGPGSYEPIVVEKSLTIRGLGRPTISSELQVPAVTVRSEKVNISGFKIVGKPADPTAKFDLYMETLSKGSFGRSVPLRLNLPNAAVLVERSGLLLENTSVEGAEIGLLAEATSGIELRNTSFQQCEIGVSLINCAYCTVDSCRFEGCTKEAGLNVVESYHVRILNIAANNNTHAGVLLKEASMCLAEGNRLSGNAYGISLWNTTNSAVRGNLVEHNHYGILISGSDNNTVMENDVVDNSRNEIVSGFGIGISLQANSSYNVVAKNLVQRSFNGLEIIRGCEKNAVVCNEISGNTRGVRVDKNRNNLFYRNDFSNNLISAYDNQTHNFWNATVGNYYDDYLGADADGDGVGDEPYPIPMGSSGAADHRPLMAPWDCGQGLDLGEVARALHKYANYKEVEVMPVKLEEGGAVIEFKRSRSPPTFEDTKPPGDREGTWTPLGF